jgi:hypothetical protein
LSKEINMANAALPFRRKDSAIEFDGIHKKTTFFHLPAELRTQIWKLVFDPLQSHQAALSGPTCNEPTPQTLQDDYWASDYLQPLLTCRQFYRDAHLLAFSRTTFAIRNPYTVRDIEERMQARLSPQQVASIRTIAVVCEARHFRQMHHWKGCAFGIPSLQLDDMIIVLHRSSYWHYLFEFNAMLASLLRDFEGAKRVTFVRNRALVKPHFHTWFNRFVGAMLSLDRVERYGRVEARIEKSWWEWEFDVARQTAMLTAVPAKPAGLDVGSYDLIMAPMMQWLKVNIENEQYDPDPMSRV